MILSLLFSAIFVLRLNVLEPVRLSLIVNVLYSEVGVNVISELLASKLFNELDLLKLH